jgi:hypothetical protein
MQFFPLDTFSDEFVVIFVALVCTIKANFDLIRLVLLFSFIIIISMNKKKITLVNKDNYM